MHDCLSQIAWRCRLCLCWAAIVAACSLTIGCGRQGYKIAPVSGRLTSQGEPVSEMHVTFQPKLADIDNPYTGPGSFGRTDSEGRFSLTLGDGTGRRGAAVGKHTVRIIVPDDAASKYTQEGRILSPLPEASADGSLEFEVPPKGTDAANFDF